MTRRGVALFGVVSSASLVVLLLRWLVPGPVGAADNGDGWRLLCHLDGREPDRVLQDYVQMTYAPSEGCASDYVSSQDWLTHAAQWLGRLIGDDAALNLYVLGALSCVLAAASVGLLAMALPLSTRGRLIAAALVLLALADSAIFGWFVSALSEGAAFLGLTATVAGLLLLQRADWWRLLGAVVTCVGAVLAVNAKAQTLPLLPVLALALLLAAKPGATLLRRWTLPVGVALVVTASTAAFQTQTSGSPGGEEYGQINAYHAVFHSIVRADSAEADLRELGLPASWARYQGTTWWGAAPAAFTDPLWPRYAGEIRRATVLEFYLTHPGRALGVLHQGAEDQLSARPEGTGSYPEGTDVAPGAQEHRVPVLSGLTRLLAPLGLFALVPLWLGALGVAAACWRRARPLAVVIGFAVLAAADQLVVAALGEGIEGVKHQLIGLYSTMLAVVLAVIGLLVRHEAGRATAAPEPVEGTDGEAPDRDDAGRLLTHRGLAPDADHP